MGYALIFLWGVAERGGSHTWGFGVLGPYCARTSEQTPKLLTSLNPKPKPPSFAMYHAMRPRPSKVGGTKKTALGLWVLFCRIVVELRSISLVEDLLL